MTANVYLDHNATSPLRPQAQSALIAACNDTGNPSSVHGAGRQTRRTIENARDDLAGLFGVAPAGVIFTSCGTEANALAISGGGRDRVLVSAVEHDSVLASAPNAEIIPVDGQGIADLAALERLLAAGGAAAVVSIMAANNEVGAIQPISKIVNIAQKYGALVHCDAVQAAGHIFLDMREIGIHMMSLSAHKLGGPMGAGALLLSDGVDVAAMIRGGGQERSRRAGTENAPAIAGFAAAALAARDSLGDEARLATLRDELEQRLRERAPDVAIYGVNAPRLGNTSCIGMPHVSNETQVMALDLEGIAVSAGAACSSGKVGSSHVLTAMGIDDQDARCAIRVSLGWTTQPGDIDQFVDAWCGLYDRTRSENVSIAV